MKREYVMTTRAQAAQATADRIIAATMKWVVTVSYNEMRLEDIAADAGVTVQTILRRFGSKEGLARACQVAYGNQVADSPRSHVRPGDLPDAVECVVAQYEESGHLLLHLLRQETTVPVYAELMESGRETHVRWCRRTFAPWLERRSGVDRDRLLAQLIAVMDVYSWFLLRRQQGLSRRQTVLAMTELLEGLLT